MNVRIECRECLRSYEFEAEEAEAQALSSACPDCGSAELVRGLPASDVKATGTYRYIARLNRIAKVSDRVPSVSQAARPSGCQAGPGGGVCPSSGSCPMRGG